MKSLRKRINELQSPEAKKLLRGLYNDLSSLIVIPNRLLPDGMQDRRTDGRTCAAINRMLRESAETGETEFDQREERIAAYAADIEAGRQIAYKPYAGPVKRKVKAIKLS